MTVRSFSMARKTWEDDWRGCFQDFINFLWVMCGLQAWENRKLTTWLSKAIFKEKYKLLRANQKWFIYTYSFLALNDNDSWIKWPSLFVQYILDPELRSKQFTSYNTKLKDEKNIMHIWYYLMFPNRTQC